MPYKDKQRQLEYQREWMRKRRAKYLDGAVCKWCGSDEKINIHHVDPTTKVHHAIWSWAEPRIVEELSKCITICEECHVTHHAEERIVHGSLARYQAGCRCEACRSAKSEENRRYRERKKNLEGTVKVTKRC